MTTYLSGCGASSCRSPSWPSPSSPHLHRTTGEVVFLVTQLMETPQISPMTAAWSPLTLSPFSVITYTCNRPTQAPKPLPSSVFLSCVRCQQCWWCWWARVPGLSAVTCVVPQWCCLHCHHTTTTIIPGATSTQYCTVLHCTVLYCATLLAARIIHLFTRSGD